MFSVFCFSLQWMSMVGDGSVISLQRRMACGLRTGLEVAKNAWNSTHRDFTNSRLDPTMRQATHKAKSKYTQRLVKPAPGVSPLGKK